MNDVTPLSQRFLDAVSPSRRRPPKHQIDDADFGEFLMRMIRVWERRVIANPEMLAQTMALVQRLGEVTNVSIAANAERYAIDPRSGASMLECARILGLGKAAASERRARGVAIMGARIDQAGAVRFAEARREREALAAAQAHAVDELAAYRARRAS
jgi:hypothetical protein